MDIITGHRGTSHVNSQDMRDANMGVIGEGTYILPVGGQLAATATGANEVTIADGVLCMQGCVATIGYGQSEVVALQAGTAGRTRRDLICAQYTKDTNGVEDIQLVVKTGTVGSSSDPSYTDGSIAGGDTLVEAPLYRVEFNGTSISAITALVGTTSPISDMSEVLRWKSDIGIVTPPNTWKTIPSSASEYLIVVYVNSSPSDTLMHSINIPNDASYFGNNLRRFVNYYGRDNNGYVAVQTRKDNGNNQIRCYTVFNGDTDKTQSNDAGFVVYWR